MLRSPFHPDLLEQRIGRLDRIGQGTDIHIHAPYLTGTAQETLFRWFDEGLNAFAATCSVGYQLHSELADTLDALLSGEGAVDALLQSTRTRRDALLRESEAGETVCSSVTHMTPIQGQTSLPRSSSVKPPKHFTTFVSTCLTEWVSSRSISTKTCL